MKKIIVCHKFLLLLDRVFNSKSFKRYWSWFEAFPYLAYISEMLVGTLWKQSITHCSGGWGPFESRVPTYCNWGPLWKQGSYALHLFLGPFETKVLTGVATGATLKAEYLTQYSCC